MASFAPDERLPCSATWQLSSFLFSQSHINQFSTTGVSELVSQSLTRVDNDWNWVREQLFTSLFFAETKLLPPKQTRGYCAFIQARAEFFGGGPVCIIQPVFSGVEVMKLKLTLSLIVMLFYLLRL